MARHPFALEDLYVHHDRDIVIDAIPAVLAWVPRGKGGGRKPPFVFEVAYEAVTGAAATAETIELVWSVAALRAHDPTVSDRARRLEHGQTVQREHVTELAGYGLAMVAIAALMPGNRVITMRRGLPPDLLFDVTPNALRGVEVAARTTGGNGALAGVRRAKQAPLAARADVTEAHLSLWCAGPRVAVHAKIKP